MGYWNSGRDGTSLHMEETGYIWGDAPADVMGTAIDQIREIFKADVGSEPSLGELRAGLEFALMRADDKFSASILDNPIAE